MANRKIQTASFVVLIRVRCDTFTKYPSSPRRRLLLLDDAPDNLEVLAVLLREKYDVFSYASCEEALGNFRDINPDLLLLDVLMYPINGVDFLKRVRAVNGFCDVPAIAVTALAQEAERQRFLAAGFQAIVIKPILDLSKLESIIDSLLQSFRDEDTRALDRLAG